MNILFNNKKYLFYTNIAILLLVLFISNGKTFFLNGIPFFSSNEKIFILIIIPILSFFL